MQIYLVTEHTFHASYLVSRWIDAFQASGVSTRVALRAQRPPIEAAKYLASIHRVHEGSRQLEPALLGELDAFYGGLGKSDLAMLERFGLPKHATISFPDTIFLGGNLNDAQIREWLTGACAGDDLPFTFVFLDQLLQPWWIELSQSRIVNGHSAVLPFARGTFAIEHIAIAQDARQFRQAAGATAHYIDTGVDTGPIIRAERLADPFSFASIWDVKGCSFSIAFDLLIDIARAIASRPDRIPVGTYSDPRSMGPCFVRRTFTLEAQQRSEAGYLAMKHAAAAGRFLELAESTALR